jgi:protoporphyrinogen IX oxidase
MLYLYLKAIHIVFIVTWFAGLFYIVRLFVYFAETDSLDTNAQQILRPQYQLMQKRLWYGITFPSAIITLILGVSLVLQLGSIPDWLWVKLFLVALLYGYHLYCHFIFLKQKSGVSFWTSTQFRIWNEVATLFLVAIVFLVVLKNFLSMVWGLVGLIIFSGLLMLAIVLYKKVRAKSTTSS